MSRESRITEALPSLRRVASRLAPYMRPHRVMLGGSLLALLAATAMKLLEPWPLKFIIDRVVPSAAAEGAAVSAMDPMTLLTLCAVGLVAVVGLKALFQYLSTIGFALVGNRVLTEVRSDLFRHLQSLSPGFHARALAEVLAGLAASPDRRARLGAAARAEVLAHHTWDGVAARVLDLARLRPRAAA